MINRAYINRQHPSLDAGILSDRGIRKAIESGRIFTGVELDDEQFQPNSLDLRLKSADIFCLNNSAIREKKDYSLPDIDVKTHILNNNDPLELPQFTASTIYFVEKLKTDYGLRVDLRSGRARRGIVNYSDLVYVDEEGNACIEITNQGKNIIKLYGYERVAHAFFYTSKEDGDGYVVSDKKELEEIAHSLSSKIEIDPPYLVFNAGEFALIQKEADIDDSRESQELFYKQQLDKINIFRERHIVLQLNPEISVPNNVAVQLLPRIPYTNQIYNDKRALFTLMHSFTVKGGWVESGYKGNLTAHLSVFNNFFLVEKDKPLIYALAYKYKEDVLRPYGSSKLKSHYQNSKGDAVKS